jgi:ABC-2 type transport system permease protein
MKEIVRLQLAMWRRDRRLATILLALGLVLSAVSTWSVWSDVTQRQAHAEAAEAARDQWEGRGSVHPHSMAHFGDFAFRPSGPLARLDRGVQARLGKVLRIEGHKQGTPLHADAARAGSVARFPQPDAAFFLQGVIPLLLIFLGALGLASDRQSGRLRQALVQGVDARSLLGGHFLALWGLGLSLLLVVVLSSWLTSIWLGSAAAGDAARLMAFVGIHALFLAVVAATTVVASVWVRAGRSALLILLAIWVVGTAVLPRAVNSASNALYPLPSRDAFQAGMAAAREDGPDGHNPKDTFIEKRRQEVLREYGVDTVEELPINFDGLAMQLDEEYANRIWDEHHGRLEAQMARQTQFGSLAALLNPFQAVDHMSMAVTGTDLHHDLDFLHQAEAYRRRLIGALNHEHAYGGSKTGERSYKSTPEFYAGLEPFSYEAPGLLEAVRTRLWECIALLLWLVFLVVALVRGGKRLERGSLSC